MNAPLAAHAPLSDRIAEARLLLVMQDDLMRKATWHHSYQQQVAGVRKLVRQFQNG